MRTRLMIVIAVSIILVLALFARAVNHKSSNFRNKDTQNTEAVVSGGVKTYLQEATAFKEQGSLLEAKEIYQKLLEMPLSAHELGVVQKKLEDLNIDILFSGVRIDDSAIYEVKPKDALFNIAKKFHTTVDSIRRANNITGNVIHPGMKLRILTGTFSIIVDKSQNTLLLKYQGDVVKTYSVSTGKNNSTPIGIYTIINKLENPVWYKDGRAILPEDPENILGTRWLGFNLRKYGIHGTTDPHHIGEQISAGCIRMRNEDVEELYSLVPTGVQVTITD